MDKEFVEAQKRRLEEIKERIEKELSEFAHKNKKLKHDWITNYPKFAGGDLEDEADEVEEYGNLLPVSYTLELELKSINEALERIKKGTYGICLKCKQPISEERLKAYPQAKYCRRCQNET